MSNVNKIVKSILEGADVRRTLMEDSNDNLGLSNADIKKLSDWWETLIADLKSSFDADEMEAHYDITPDSIRFYGAVFGDNETILMVDQFSDICKLAGIVPGKDVALSKDNYTGGVEVKFLDMSPVDFVDKITEGNVLCVESDLNTQKYRGIWFGAKTNPITVKELLDKVISANGRGFNIKSQNVAKSDNLMSDLEKVYFLTDEEGRGKFKLSQDAVDYLKSNLSSDSWLFKKLS